MKKPHLIRLESPGIYLFGAPLQVTATLIREVAITFSVPAKKSCAIAIISPDSHSEEIRGMLDGLLSKIHNDLKVEDPKIVVKIFGTGVGGRLALQTAMHWMEVNGLKISVKEVGGEHSRNILVECETGRVGICYTDNNPTGTFLTTGTARQRNPLERVQTEVLVLSQSPVKRTLAKQAVEENSQWSASTPKSPLEILRNEKFKQFPWAVVLLFEDLQNDDACLNWIKKTATQFPAVQFRWVGVEMPTFAKATPFLRHLPPLEPLLVPEFKKRLQRAVFEHMTADTNDVLKFPKVRRSSR